MPFDDGAGRAVVEKGNARDSVEATGNRELHMTEEKRLTGYPSIDRPWMQYYTNKANIPSVPSPNCSMEEFLRQCNCNRLDHIALKYFGRKTSYRKLFETISHVAVALQSHGVKKLILLASVV